MTFILSSKRSRRALWGAAVFSTGLLLNLLGSPHHTKAAVGCRADPLLTLSNGATIDLSLEIGKKDFTLQDVQHISYTLHGPVGTSLVSTSFPDGSGNISTVTYVADDAPGSYDGDTVVTTGSKVKVTSYLSVVTLPTDGGTPTPVEPEKGHSGQDVYTHLYIG